MKKLNKERIVSQISAEKESAFEQLFKEHYPRLVSISNKIIGDIDDSKDCAQAVFVKLFENEEKFENINNLKAYLNRAVINTSINFNKKKSKTIGFVTNVLNSTSISQFRDLIEESEEESKIWKVINELPPQSKKVFIMSRFQDLSNQEISIKLNISKRTVETHISKSLKFLRGKLLYLCALFI